MMEFDLPAASISQIVEVLVQSVGPRQYWVTHEVGGVGWKIRLRDRKLILPDEHAEIATFITLKFS
jgi:hypothetical protein